MCGRYALSAVIVDFVRDYGVEQAPDFPVADRFNIAPTQPVLIVREDRDSGSGRRELAHVVWGLIPPWAPDPSIASKMINARAETAPEKPAFRNALKRRRCLIPATGFYEWCKAPNGEPPPAASAELISPDLFGESADAPATPRAPAGILRSTGAPPLETAAGTGRAAAKKVPYFFQMRDGAPFAFGGLWEAWSGPQGELLESCTILTTSANDLVAPIHERMPVIVPPESYDLWLDPMQQDVAEIRPLLRPYAPERMRVHQVATRVNNPRNEGPELISPA